jgi:hypothetical protein
MGPPWRQSDGENAQKQSEIGAALRAIPGCHPAETVTPSRDDELVVSITRVEQFLHFNRTTLSRRIRDGFIQGERLTPHGPWRTSESPTTSAAASSVTSPGQTQP